MNKNAPILIACEESGIVTEAFIANGFTNVFSCDIIKTSGRYPDRHIIGNVLHILDGKCNFSTSDGISHKITTEFSLIIAFPPCTYLCSSGMHWTTRGLRDSQLTIDAIHFVKKIWEAECKRIVIENPIGILSKEIRKPDQIIQPWMFGEDASKQTCLWIKGLPKLIPTKIIPPKEFSNVVFADDLPLCELCEEPFCVEHGLHYQDCECIGPTQDGFVYREKNGVLFAQEERKNTSKLVWGNQTPSGQNKLGPSPNRAKIRSRTYLGIAKAFATQWTKE